MSQLRRRPGIEGGNIQVFVSSFKVCPTQRLNNRESGKLDSRNSAKSENFNRRKLTKSLKNLLPKKRKKLRKKL